jgi:hypothetical protein
MRRPQWAQSPRCSRASRAVALGLVPVETAGRVVFGPVGVLLAAAFGYRDAGAAGLGAGARCSLHTGIVPFAPAENLLRGYPRRSTSE